MRDFDTASLPRNFVQSARRPIPRPPYQNVEPRLGYQSLLGCGQFRKRTGNHVPKKCFLRSDSLFYTHRLWPAPRVPIHLATVRRTFLP